MLVDFHIGAAESDMAWFGSVSWPSLNFDLKLGLGSVRPAPSQGSQLCRQALRGVDKPVRRAIMGENAAELHRIDLATFIAATSAARPSRN